MLSFDILKLWTAGGITLLFIVFLSLVVLTLALERTLVLWRFLDRATTLAETIERCLRRGAWTEARSACERSPSPMADVFLLGFSRHGRSEPGTLSTAVERERQRVALTLRRGMWLVGTIGASAPFVGLLGTVWGTVRALEALGAQHQTGIDVVGPGIAEALISTAFGILVGLEAVLVYNYFQSKLHAISMELRLMTEEFVELLQELGPEASGATPPPGSAAPLSTPAPVPAGVAPQPVGAAEGR